MLKEALQREYMLDERLRGAVRQGNGQLGTKPGDHGCLNRKQRIGMGMEQNRYGNAMGTGSAAFIVESDRGVTFTQISQAARPAAEMVVVMTPSVSS